MWAHIQLQSYLNKKKSALNDTNHNNNCRHKFLIKKKNKTNQNKQKYVSLSKKNIYKNNNLFKNDILFWLQHPHHIYIQFHFNLQ